MTVRRRYVYRQNEAGDVEAVEISPDREIQARTEISMDRHYENLCATDGTDIGSRQKHREYMRVNGLTTADDYKETWAKAAEQRAAFFTEGGGATEKRERREALGRAFYELEKRGRR